MYLIIFKSVGAICNPISMSITYSSIKEYGYLSTVSSYLIAKITSFIFGNFFSQLTNSLSINNFFRINSFILGANGSLFMHVLFLFFNLMCQGYLVKCILVYLHQEPTPLNIISVLLVQKIFQNKILYFIEKLLGPAFILQAFIQVYMFIENLNIPKIESIIYSERKTKIEFELVAEFFFLVLRYEILMSFTKNLSKKEINMSIWWTYYSIAFFDLLNQFNIDINSKFFDEKMYGENKKLFSNIYFVASCLNSTYMWQHSLKEIAAEIREFIQTEWGWENEEHILKKYNFFVITSITQILMFSFLEEKALIIFMVLATIIIYFTFLTAPYFLEVLYSKKASLETKFTIFIGLGMIMTINYLSQTTTFLPSLLLSAYILIFVVLERRVFPFMLFYLKIILFMFVIPRILQYIFTNNFLLGAGLNFVLFFLFFYAVLLRTFEKEVNVIYYYIY